MLDNYSSWYSEICSVSLLEIFLFFHSLKKSYYSWLETSLGYYKFVCANFAVSIKTLETLWGPFIFLLVLLPYQKFSFLYLVWDECTVWSPATFSFLFDKAFPWKSVLLFCFCLCIRKHSLSFIHGVHHLLSLKTKWEIWLQSPLNNQRTHLCLQINQAHCK